MLFTISDDQRRLLALCAIRTDNGSMDWSLIAREAQGEAGLNDLWQGYIKESSVAAKKSIGILHQGLLQKEELLERVDAELAAAQAVGARLVTVLDDSYPTNLRLIPNLPPFLFIRGELLTRDTRSIAVVGTRSPSDPGVNRACRMSKLLAEQGVTVVSGLARGIDTAAHQAALGAGGRTIAVLGTGITKCYPPENRELSEEVAHNGALVSQFWPTRSPSRDTFPRRNVVTSGLSQGTVVIEASSTSGAKMQARLALEHGKKVFLLRTLVATQPWANDYVQERGAMQVENVEEVTRHLASAESIYELGRRRRQLTLSLK